MTRAERKVARVVLQSPYRLLRKSFCLPMNSLEDEDFYAPIKSRLARLAIVDVLAVGVALSRGPDFQLALGVPKQPHLQPASSSRS